MSTIAKNDTNINDYSISQGDIFKNIKYLYEFNESSDYIDVKEVIFPYVIVLSQACDLKGMHEIIKHGGKSTKQMISVLLAPLFDKSKVQDGSYLKKILIQETTIEKGFNSKEKK